MGTYTRPIEEEIQPINPQEFQNEPDQWEESTYTHDSDTKDIHEYAGKEETEARRYDL